MARKIKLLSNKQNKNNLLEVCMASGLWYDDFYQAVEKSKAYTAYCTQAFGRDFSQQGFSNMEQIAFMLEKVRLQPDGKVLDVGCGNGKMVEYIASAKGVTGYGFDISEAAIEAAIKRTAGKENLFFRKGSINDINYEEQSFDAVLSVDTLYFADDLLRTIREILQWIKPGGCFAAFFSEFRFSREDPLDKLTPHGTGLAKALIDMQIPYDVYDFTKSHYDVMRRKKIVLSGMKQQFEAEGTSILFDNAFTESIEEDMSFEEFSKFSARYLYIIRHD
jgi:2-polyprenyl-3-methyl-5-hydroxy-6-metoxy-1,4-benzoquinol methylase